MTTARDNPGSTSLVGDGRCVRVACNSGRLLVVGNRVEVTVERNDGEVRVVGNHGRVLVARNRGTVQYVGNAGCVRAPGGGRVDYAGSRGHVERDLPEEDACSPCAKCPASASASASASVLLPALPARGAPQGEPLVFVAHRPDASSQFREVHVRTNAPPTTINVSVSKSGKWCSRFSKGVWIAT